MFTEYIPINIFFVTESNQEIHKHIPINSKKLIAYTFSGFYSALAHIHINPDYVFILGTEYSDNIDIDEFIKQIRELSPSSGLIFFDDNPTWEKAVEFIKMGLNDYKDYNSFTNEYLKNLLEELSGDTLIVEENSKRSIIDKFREYGFWGTGRRMRKLYRILEDTSKTDVSTLIFGEPGLEQVLAANTLHNLSKRQSGPFIQFDVLAYPLESIEFELFGREKSTDAGIEKRKIGAIELASGGSLCIENIEQLPKYLQSRLLRAIRERKFIKPGGQNIVFWNTRLLAICYQSPDKAIKNGELKDDLYFFMSSIQIKIPSLRDRGQDIILLSNNILRNFLRQHRLKSLTLSEEAKEKLLNYNFPSNVMELKSIIESAALLADGDKINANHILLKNKTEIDFNIVNEMSLEEYNDQILGIFLEKYNNDILIVAQKLRIGKSTIYRMLKNKPYLLKK